MDSQFNTSDLRPPITLSQRNSSFERDLNLDLNTIKAQVVPKTAIEDGPENMEVSSAVDVRYGCSSRKKQRGKEFRERKSKLSPTAGQTPMTSYADDESLSSSDSACMLSSTEKPMSRVSKFRAANWRWSKFDRSKLKSRRKGRDNKNYYVDLRRKESVAMVQKKSSLKNVSVTERKISAANTRWKTNLPAEPKTETPLQINFSGNLRNPFDQDSPRILNFQTQGRIPQILTEEVSAKTRSENSNRISKQGQPNNFLSTTIGSSEDKKSKTALNVIFSMRKSGTMRKTDQVETSVLSIPAPWTPPKSLISISKMSFGRLLVNSLICSPPPTPSFITDESPHELLLKAFSSVKENMPKKHDIIEESQEVLKVLDVPKSGPDISLDSKKNLQENIEEPEVLMPPKIAAENEPIESVLNERPVEDIPVSVPEKPSECSEIDQEESELIQSSPAPVDLVSEKSGPVELVPLISVRGENEVSSPFILEKPSESRLGEWIDKIKCKLSLSRFRRDDLELSEELIIDPPSQYKSTNLKEESSQIALVSPPYITLAECLVEPQDSLLEFVKSISPGIRNPSNSEPLSRNVKSSISPRLSWSRRFSFVRISPKVFPEDMSNNNSLTDTESILEPEPSSLLSTETVQDGSMKSLELIFDGIKSSGFSLSPEHSSFFAKFKKKLRRKSDLIPKEETEISIQLPVPPPDAPARRYSWRNIFPFRRIKITKMDNLGRTLRLKWTKLKVWITLKMKKSNERTTDNTNETFEDDIPQSVCVFQRIKYARLRTNFMDHFLIPGTRKRKAIPRRMLFVVQGLGDSSREKEQETKESEPEPILVEFKRKPYFHVMKKPELIRRKNRKFDETPRKICIRKKFIYP